MRLKKILPKFMLLAFLLPSSGFAKIKEDDILGHWLSENKDGVVHVKKVDGDYKGYLVWIKLLATGEKKVVLDNKNPDEELQKRSLLGVRLFQGFEFDGDEWTGGEIYDPDSGKTYKCKMSLDDDKKTLNLRGYVGIPLFGRTSHWTKINDMSKYTIPAPKKSEKVTSNFLKNTFQAVKRSKVIGRDSGQAITDDFLQSCIKEQTDIFVKYECDDFVNTVMVGQLDAEHLILLGDGVSVENREVYRRSGADINYLDIDLEKVVTEKDVAELLNKKFKTTDYTEEEIKRIAHSHFRTELPRKMGDPIVVKSGYLGQETDHGFKPIATLKWNGKSFELVK